MLTGTTSRKRKYDVLTQVEYGLYYPSDIPSDREGNWNAAGLSLRSPRFLSNRWGPPQRDGKTSPPFDGVDFQALCALASANPGLY